MGGYLSSNMEEMSKKQMQRQQEMQEKQMALMLARSRDNLNWISAFSATAAVALLSGYRKTRKPFLLAPLLPLTFANAFYWDLAYGTKMFRIRSGAEHILAFETDILKMPVRPEPSSSEPVLLGIEVPKTVKTES